MKKIQSSQLLLLVFLLPSFLQRIFIGGEISSYSDITGISLTFLGYFSHIVVIIISLSNKTLFKNQIILKYILPITLLSLIHLLLLTDFNEETWNAAALGIARSLIWVSACATIAYYVTPDELMKMLIRLIDISLIVIILTMIIYHLTGIPFQMIFSAGIPRAQAFFTEPSTVGAFIAGYFALAIFNKDKKRIVLSILAVYFVNSVLTLLGLITGFFIGVISQKFYKQKNYKKILRGGFISIFVLLFIIGSFSTDISNYAKEVEISLEGSDFSNSSFYHIFFNRLLQAMVSFNDGIILVRNNENIDAGGLFRYTSILLLLEQMSSSWRAFTGYGLGAHAQVMLSQGKSILDFGFLPLLLSSFGYILGAVIFYWIVRTITKHQNQLTIFIVPFFVLAILNSAGGIHTYSIVLVSVFILSMKHKSNNNSL